MSLKPTQNQSDDYHPMELPGQSKAPDMQLERRFYQLGILLLFILLLLSLWQNQAAAEAQGLMSRYLILQNQFLFERVNLFPYEILRPMCWSPKVGWCDKGMEQAGHRVVYVIDYETGRYGVVMQNDSGCWFWWFKESFGVDNNPHIDEHYWITCPEPLTP
jgi:hypothetical protein